MIALNEILLFQQK